MNLFTIMDMEKKQFKFDTVMIVANAFIVVGVLTVIGEPYWMSALTVGAGELAVMTFTYILFMLLKRNKNFLSSIKANQHLNFKF